jgi:hypothetical protein
MNGEHRAVMLAGLLLVGCGDDAGSGGGGTTSSTTGSATTGTGATTGASTTGTGATTGSGTTSTGTGMQGAGSCASPIDITLPFSVADLGDSSAALDGTAPPCSPEPLPEVVYRLTLAAETTVTITANDNSGQGVGVHVQAADCMGMGAACEWASNGIVDRELTLPAGVWVFVVERRPAGSYDFAVE